jgi:hypothetical protein
MVWVGDAVVEDDDGAGGEISLKACAAPTALEFLGALSQALRPGLNCAAPTALRRRE